MTAQHLVLIIFIGTDVKSCIKAVMSLRACLHLPKDRCCSERCISDQFRGSSLNPLNQLPVNSSYSSRSGGVQESMLCSVDPTLSRSKLPRFELRYSRRQGLIVFTNNNWKCGVTCFSRNILKLTASNLIHYN